MNPFVLGVLVAAIIAIGRLGGEEEISRRLYQAGFAFLLVLLVQGATAVFFRPSEVPNQGLVNHLEDLRRSNAEGQELRLGVEAALGAGLILAGLHFLDDWETIGLASVLGGVATLAGNLLVADNINYRLGESYGRNGLWVDLVYTAVLAVALVFLLRFGYMRWDRALEPEHVADSPADDESV